ncbi:MAG: thioredoxin family protein [Bacteroidales bacterium]|nr:thioredoxin family protein [Bacteroidales bacterium]MDY0216538.1 thioredoxin family protein [Bacteroidales bacterium]
MILITDNFIPEEVLESKASIILFGNQHCSVCSALKLKLQTVMIEILPELTFAYVDTNLNPILAASHSVFTVPVAVFRSENKEYNRWVRSFSIQEIIAYCQRMLMIQNS